MNHIRFLTTNKTVCMNPKTLGYDFVVIDTDRDAVPCRECGRLLFAHNAKEAAKEEQNELWASMLQGPKTHVGKKRTSLMRELTYALIFSVILWAAAFLIIWAVYFRG